MAGKQKTTADPTSVCHTLRAYFPCVCVCLLRPGVTLGCWSVCGSPVTAAAGCGDVLSVEEEERPESVPGAAPHGAFSTSMLCSGHPGLSVPLGHVSSNAPQFIADYIFYY